MACTIDPPPVTAQVRAIAPVVQTVKVEPMQQVIQPVYNTVHVTEYQQVKQKVQRPVMETQMVNQTVTVMQPVTEVRTAQVPTVDYQTVTEYRKVQKQAGYWATKTESTGKVAACQYDNRPGFMGWMNRSAYATRTAFTPQTRSTRTFVPQTMTCTVPCTKKVAVQGMKQVTYTVTSMVPQQQTRQVAVNTVRYVEQEITAMQPVTVARTVQVGHRVSHVPMGSVTASGGSVSTPATATGPTPIGAGGSGSASLTPTVDEKASAKKPSSTPTRTATGTDDETGFGRESGAIDTKSRNADRSEVAEVVIPSRPAVKTPSVVRVSQWVAHNPKPNLSNPEKSSSAVAIAGTTR
jgi:hypothetical protein